MSVPLRRAGGSLLLALVALALPASAAHAAGPAPVCHGTTTAVAPGGERAFSLHCQAVHEPQRATIVDGPDHGTLEVLSGIRVLYTPAAGHTGEDSFTFRVAGGGGRTAVLTQQLRITNDNLAPQCLALELLAVGGMGAVERPCYDPNEGDAAHITVVEEPEHLDVAIASGPARLTYDVLEPGFLGTDAFSLRASDGTLTGPAAAITVDVAPLEPPVCEAPGVLPVRTGAARQFHPVCSDNTPSATEFFTYEVLDQPAHGTLEKDFIGGFTYTPAAGYEGKDDFTFRPVGPGGAGPALKVHVTVADDANLPPVCTAGETLRVRSGESIAAPAGCEDPDGDALELTTTPAPAHGTLTEGSYTADEDHSGPDTYTLRARDPFGAVATVTQDVVVVGDDENTLPECPAFAPRVRNDRDARIPLSCADAEHDALTYSWTEPQHGTLFAGDGFLIYTPDAGYAGVDRFTYRASDGRGQTVPIEVLLQVVAPPAPTCEPTTRRSVAPGETVGVNIVCTDDEGPVTTALHVDAEHGTVTKEGRFSFYEYTPDPGFTGLDEFTVRATSAGGTADVVQEIMVTADASAPPVCQPDLDALVAPGEAITLKPYCEDADGDALTFETVSGPAHGEVGAWNQAARTIVYTADAGFTGDDTFTFAVSDGHGDPVLVTQYVRVQEAVNHAPACSPFQGHIAPGESIALWAQCSDADADTLEYVVDDGPEHGVATDPDRWGRIAYTPDEGFEGIDTFTLTAYDDASSSEPVTISIQVGEPKAPKCKSLSHSVAHGKQRTVQLHCTTWSGAPAALEIVDGPDHGKIGPIAADGTVAYKPDAGFSGTDWFTYRGTADGLTSPVAKVELVVAPPPKDEGPPTPPKPEPPKPPKPPVDPGNPPPPPPPGPDAAERAAERALGGDAVASPGLELGGLARAFVRLELADRTLTVDSATERLVAIVCSTACDVTAIQRVTFARSKGRAPKKAVRLPVQRLRLGAAEAGVVYLRLTQGQRRKLRKAGRAKLKLTVIVTDAAGRTVRDSATFTLLAP